MTKHNISNFHEFISTLEDDHITALRQIRTLAITTHKLVRELCGVGCVYARSLRMDAERRAEFYAEAFPRGWKRFHRSKLLLHVLMYFYGVTDRRSVGYGTASAHAVALRGIYDNRDISDDDVMRNIEASGIFAGWHDDDDADDSGIEEAGDDDAADAAIDDAGDADQESAVRRPITTPSIFDEEDELTDDEETEQENEAPDETEEVIRRPVRKAAEPAVVSVPRLQWAYVELCVLARPRSQDREAILGLLRNDKSVWVKLKPGKRLEFELHKGDGFFIDTVIEEFKAAED